MKTGKAFEYFVILLLTAIWGSAFSIIKVALGYFTPWQLILARFLPTVPVFAWICWSARDKFRNLDGRDWLKLIAAGLAGVVAYNLALNTGQTRVGAGMASLVIALNPPTILLLAVIFRGERVRQNFLLGMAAAFVGVAVLSLSRNGLGIDQTTLSGVAVILFCPVTWSAYTILLADLVPKLGIFVAPAASVLVGTVMLLPSLPTSFPNGLPTGWAPWLCAGSLALLSTIVAFTFWAWLLEKRGAARTGFVVYLNVLWGLLTAIAVLGEEFTWQMTLGAALILSGVAIARRKQIPS
jgi:drug/metabolite transporter (DMT)-like permease